MEANVKLDVFLLSMLALLSLAACSGVTRVPETPELGVSTSGVSTGQAAATSAGATQPAQASASPAATATAVPTTVPPTPTVGLPEGAILLPTSPRTGPTTPPNTPIPIFGTGVLEATLAAGTPAAPQVAVYNGVFQRYQGGAMLYIAEMREIWVMVETPGRRGGPYYRFPDQFQEGDPEAILDLPVPPGLLQPHRGFGRIWREQPGLRAQLGWAADYEIPFTLRAARTTTGAFDASGNFVPGAVVWMMTLHDNNFAFFNEASSTWAMGSLQ
jgi:hypothetical protein